MKHPASLIVFLRLFLSAPLLDADESSLANPGLTASAEGRLLKEGRP